MTKNEFLNQLKSLLKNIPEEDMNEILYDYEEHFRLGMEEGKSEEEVCVSLGDVKLIARQFKADVTIKQAERNTSTGNTFRAVLAALGMGFFNTVFVVGPFFGIVGVLIGLFAAAAGIIASGVGILIALILAPVFPSYIAMDVNEIFAFFTSIGITCLGLLFLIGDCYLAKYFYGATVRYLRWNIEIIKK